MSKAWEKMLLVVGIAVIWISILFIFAIMVGWLIRFSRLVSKSHKAWRAHTGGHTGGDSGEDIAYVLRQEFAKHVLCVLCICTIIVFIPIMGVHNGSILDSYNPSNKAVAMPECNVSSESWLGDMYDGESQFNWWEHSQWQPFAIVTFSTFELIVLQLVTSQYTRTNRIFTWQVKVTACFAVLEFIAVFLLNCFIQSIFFGHTLYVFLIIVHLFIIDICVVRIYCLMKRQIADLAHMKSRDYYQSLRYRTHYQAFFIPVIVLIHVSVAIEVVFLVSIVVETIFVNRCWVMATYGINYQVTEWDNYVKNLKWTMFLDVSRQIVGMLSLWYLVVAQLVYSLKERKKEKEAKENSGSSSVMQESDDVTVPLMKNVQTIV